MPSDTRVRQVFTSRGFWLAVAFVCAVTFGGTWALQIQTRGGRIITGLIMLDLSLKGVLIVILLRDRTRAKVFLDAAFAILGIAKEERSVAVSKAGEVIARAVGEVKHEAAKIVVAAEAVKLSAGDSHSIPKGTT